MNILDQIRPRAEHLTDEHSLEMLNRVQTTPQRRRKPRWNWVAAFGLCGVIVAGGTAHATGLVPDIVTERFQQLRDGQDGWPYPINGERLVADIPLGNGKHARIWYADTADADGQCVIRDMTGTVTRPEDVGIDCARWNPGEETDPRRGVYWQISPDGPAVVYGEFKGVTADVASVEVTGPGWTRSFPVEETAFGGEVPTGADGDQVRFNYLDARGNTIASRTDTVAIESE
ncbi:MAG: hypothetical protein QM714_17595 [Nocardioides sp.]|uniref:hypothetical protein n=1 Tax=Nocardioides sp. TaxID=35761 RepID=UPI0039E5B23B